MQARGCRCRGRGRFSCALSVARILTWGTVHARDRWCSSWPKSTNKPSRSFESRGASDALAGDLPMLLVRLLGDSAYPALYSGSASPSWTSEGESMMRRLSESSCKATTGVEGAAAMEGGPCGECRARRWGCSQYRARVVVILGRGTAPLSASPRRSPFGRKQKVT